ncbi:TPA: lycopene cyclase domain-containing protein [Candidatus Saccharibacteria bacterium]|nr:lycopene cyclase domain-containing protein [Candidatus Saccharibacteria bacterium]|tara:strand:+ start:636 stop:950 length:315 start_codon:yes stop_codon:yes gene_type:complete
MMFIYLATLSVSIACLALIDWRYKLAFWHNARQTTLTITATIVMFGLWDFFGIAFGIFYHGNSPYSLPFTIAPEFPLEELFFLFLLSYCTLLVYRGIGIWRSRI